MQSEIMVRSKLRVLIASENLKRAQSGLPALTQQEVAENTRIAPSVVNGLVTNRSKRVDFETLNKLCKFFDVQPGDILEYTPDEPQSE